MDLELVANFACHTGENPYWHPDEECVYWLDIPQGRLLRYDPADGSSEICLESEDAIGGFTVQEDGALLLFGARGEIYRWRGRRLTTIVEEIADERDSRFNDVIADPAGRVYCGTMSSPDHKGRLYRLEPDGTTVRILEGIGTSNGLGFTPDRTRLYYTDTGAADIYRFDYHQETGDITNRHVFVHVDDGAGKPDGMTVDAEGCVWSARWDGWCLVRYRPDGSEDLRVEIPAKKVSSLTFGGRDYRDIYITTAGGQNPGENGEEAGALYRLRAGIQGVPEFRSRIGIG